MVKKHGIQIMKARTGGYYGNLYGVGLMTGWSILSSLISVWKMLHFPIFVFNFVKSKR